jgi:hypothetical protein
MLFLVPLAALRLPSGHVRFGSIVLKNPVVARLAWVAMVAGVRVDEGRVASGDRKWRLCGDQLSQFPQVLDSGGEKELIAGAAGTS